MTAAEAPNRRESHKAMEEKMTTARRVIRQVASGRPPADRKPGIVEALYLGRAMANKLSEAAVAAGLAEEAAGCIFVCARPGSSAPSYGSFLQTDQDANDLDMGREAARSGEEPIGVVLFIFDHEVDGIRSHARAFERSERSERILAEALATWQQEYGL